MPTEGITKKNPVERLFQLLQSIKEDTEYIKRRLSIEKVDSEELTEAETSDPRRRYEILSRGKL